MRPGGPWQCADLVVTGDLLSEVLRVSSVEVTEGGREHLDILISRLFLAHTDHQIIRECKIWGRDVLYEMNSILQLQPVLPGARTTTLPLLFHLLSAGIPGEVHV